ncbi:MAG: PEGA domain-containing protein [Myxococcales bacterium]|jgi:hypothetical protein|nr:PEGA domain-containing protein [Myxococcales bacterium]
MSKRLGSIILALTLLCSANAFAARRTAVLVLPQDPKSHVSSAKFVEYLEDAVDQHKDCVLKRSSDTLGDSTPIEALSARKKLRSAVSQAKRQINVGNLDEAEENLRAAINEFSKAAPVMESCGEICDTLIHLAGIEFLKGEEKSAREAIGDVLAMDDSFKFDGAAFDKAFMLLYREIQQRKMNQGRLGMLVVESSPTGARVFVDGEDRGYTPVTFDHLPVGKHILRVERAGYISYGQMVEVSEAGASTVKARLNPTDEFASIADNVETLSKDIDRRRGSRALARVGAKLQVERALLGTIRTENARVKLNLILVDFTEQSILAADSKIFQEDEYGEIAKEVQRLGMKVINAANSRQIRVNSRDPLDQTDGTEDWGEEDRGHDRSFEQDDRPQRQPASQSRNNSRSSSQSKKKSSTPPKKSFSDGDRYDSSPRSSSSSSSTPKSNSMGDEPIDSW